MNGNTSDQFQNQAISSENDPEPFTIQNTEIFCSENSVDPDQLASQKPADQDPLCFPFPMLMQSNYWNPVN